MKIGMMDDVRYITDDFFAWEKSENKKRQAVAKFLDRDTTSILTDGKVWWTEREPLPECHFKVIRSFMMKEYHCPYLYEKERMQQTLL